MKWLPGFIILLFLKNSAGTNPAIFKTSWGKVQFHSEAQMEVIRASSQKLNGLINADTRKFAFAVPITSFDGFNGALQKEHFNENYMESDRYPLASFSGKIIEEVDLTASGNYSVRAKGNLSLHGVELDRIIRVILVVKGNTIEVASTFTVQLADHNIRIPKIVHEKVASEISVSIQAELLKQTP